MIEAWEAEAVKLREMVRCAQASALEAVGIARRANWRARIARAISVVSIIAVTVLAAYLLLR
jgi:predicted DNA-binding protein (UPF0251 family)